jgi:hypothetical protein
MNTSQHNPSLARDGVAAERILHSKPIPLRLPESERNRAFELAKGENRSASNFVLHMYRRGVADFERERAAAGGVQ